MTLSHLSPLLFPTPPLKVFTTPRRPRSFVSQCLLWVIRPPPQPCYLDMHVCCLYKHLGRDNTSVSFRRRQWFWAELVCAEASVASQVLSARFWQHFKMHYANVVSDSDHPLCHLEVSGNILKQAACSRRKSSTACSCLHYVIKPILTFIMHPYDGFQLLLFDVKRVSWPKLQKHTVSHHYDSW